MLPPPLGEGWGGGNLRLDHAIFEGLQVPPYYDSMLGKLVAHGPTREAAIERLAAALDQLQLLGLPNNRALLAACLRHPVFRAGQAGIPFLARHGAELRQQLLDAEATAVDAAALRVLLPQGTPGALALPFTRPARLRHRGAVIAVDVHEPRARAVPACDAVHVGASRWHVQLGGVDLFLEDASFEPPQGAGAGAGGDELRAPFNGRVVAVATQPGAKVKKGDTLVVIESMKLEHALTAGRDGVVKAVHVAAGQQAAAAQVLVKLEAG